MTRKINICTLAHIFFWISHFVKFFLNKKIWFNPLFWSEFDRLGITNQAKVRLLCDFDENIIFFASICMLDNTSHHASKNHSPIAIFECLWVFYVFFSPLSCHKWKRWATAVKIKEARYRGSLHSSFGWSSPHLVQSHFCITRIVS